MHRNDKMKKKHSQFDQEKTVTHRSRCRKAHLFFASNLGRGLQRRGVTISDLSTAHLHDIWLWEMGQVQCQRWKMWRRFHQRRPVQLGRCGSQAAYAQARAPSVARPALQLDQSLTVRLASLMDLKSCGRATSEPPVWNLTQTGSYNFLVDT